MDKMDLKKYGITGRYRDRAQSLLRSSCSREETKPGLRGFEKGQVTETGAVNVMTGVYTGRSPEGQVLRHGRDHQGYDLVDFRRV